MPALILGTFRKSRKKVIKSYVWNIIFWNSNEKVPVHNVGEVSAV